MTRRTKQAPRALRPNRASTSEVRRRGQRHQRFYASRKASLATLPKPVQGLRAKNLQGGLKAAYLYPLDCSGSPFR